MHLGVCSADPLLKGLGKFLITFVTDFVFAQLP